MKKILLIDDKPYHQEGCGAECFRSLHGQLQAVVEFHMDIARSISIPNADEVALLFSEGHYELVLFHASYDSLLVNLGQLIDFKAKVGNVITFSGGSEPKEENRSTSRLQLFRALPKALEAYIEMDIFPIRILFNPNLSRFYPLLDRMQTILEEEDGKEQLLRSVELSKFIKILGYPDVRPILENYANKSVDWLNEKVGEWKLMHK